jgi:hypothetical protein
MSLDVRSATSAIPDSLQGRALIVRILGEFEWTRRASAREFLLADEQSLVPRSLALVDGTYRHRGSPPPRPPRRLYRERTDALAQFC